MRFHRKPTKKSKSRLKMLVKPLLIANAVLLAAIANGVKAQQPNAVIEKSQVAEACDNDADCDSGLKCVQNAGESFGFARDDGICMQLGSNCSTANPCGHGAGECSDDTQCGSDLTCAHNIGFSGNLPVDVCVDFMQRPFNEFTWLMTHNSYSNEQDNPSIENWLGMVANQHVSIEQQLKDGVRGFMFDTHWSNPNDAGYGVYLCHGDDCYWRGFSKTLHYYLKNIKTFLDTNRNEVVTIILEDYVKDNWIGGGWWDLIRTHLTSYIFNPYLYPNILNDNWPTLREMITTNKRLLILSDSVSADNARPYSQFSIQLGIVGQWDWTIENHYGNDSVNKNKIYENRGQSKPLNTNETFRLFTMNHFPTLGNSDHNNSAELSYFTHTRANFTQSKRLPNFIAVDYYDDKKNDAAPGFVQDLETMKRYGIGFVVTFEGDTTTPYGYYQNPVDLNSDAGGEFIYLVTRGSRELAPLTVIQGNNPEITCPTSHPNKLNTDLNQEARGDFIYFCVNADGLERTKVIAGNNNASCGAGWTRINQDLNENAGGAFVYLCVR